MAFPKIGYRTVLETATLSGSVASGFPLSNLVDRRAWSVAKAPSLSAVDWDADVGADTATNYVALCGGNLAAENVTLTIKGDTAAHGAPATTVRATIVPGDWPSSGVWMVELGSLTLRYWRFSLSAASANPAYLGVIYLGQILTLTENLAAAVDPNYVKVDSSIETGETGNLLGAALRCKVREFDLDLGDAGMEWADLDAANGLNDFYDLHAGKKRAFFFHPNIAAPTIFEPTFMYLKDDADYSRALVGGRYSRRKPVLHMRSAIAEAA